LGFFSVFAPPIEKEEETPQKSDRNLIIILSIISFFVLFFRTRDMGVSGLVIAIVGSLLVAGMSVMIVYFPDPDEEEPIDEIKTEVELPRLNISTYLRPGIALLIVITIVFFTYKQVNRKTVITNQEVPTPTTTIFPPVEEAVVPSPLPTLDEKILKQTPITILNGTDKIGSASAMAEFLLSKKFVVAKVADADRNDYQNLLIRFRPEEYGVVRYLVDIIQGIYPSIVREPLSTDSAQVIMILGKPQ